MIRLTTCADGVEAEMILALLRTYEIPGVATAAGPGAPGAGAAIGAIVGGYAALVGGDRFAPQDILVHEEDLDTAREILTAPVDEEPTESGT